MYGELRSLVHPLCAIQYSLLDMSHPAGGSRVTLSFTLTLSGLCRSGF